ncbi:MAG: hypothetical protein HY537_05610 [Deltaproteobacteria bacterium]|nr:hypothetical protein [Deltaproteobacteria bacterium]
MIPKRLLIGVALLFFGLWSPTVCFADNYAEFAIEILVKTVRHQDHRQLLIPILMTADQQKFEQNINLRNQASIRRQIIALFPDVRQGDPALQQLCARFLAWTYHKQSCQMEFEVREELSRWRVNTRSVPLRRELDLAFELTQTAPFETLFSALKTIRSCTHPSQAQIAADALRRWNASIFPGTAVQVRQLANELALAAPVKKRELLAALDDLIPRLRRVQYSIPPWLDDGQKILRVVIVSSGHKDDRVRAEAVDILKKISPIIWKPGTELVNAVSTAVQSKHMDMDTRVFFASAMSLLSRPSLLPIENMIWLLTQANNTEHSPEVRNSFKMLAKTSSLDTRTRNFQPFESFTHSPDPDIVALTWEKLSPFGVHSFAGAIDTSQRLRVPGQDRLPPAAEPVTKQVTEHREELVHELIVTLETLEKDMILQRHRQTLRELIAALAFFRNAPLSDAIELAQQMSSQIDEIREALVSDEGHKHWQQIADLLLQLQTSDRDKIFPSLRPVFSELQQTHSPMLSECVAALEAYSKARYTLLELLFND